MGTEIFITARDVIFDEVPYLAVRILNAKKLIRN